MLGCPCISNYSSISALLTAWDLIYVCDTLLSKDDGEDMWCTQNPGVDLAPVFLSTGLCKTEYTSEAITGEPGPLMYPCMLPKAIVVHEAPCHLFLSSQVVFKYCLL